MNTGDLYPLTDDNVWCLDIEGFAFCKTVTIRTLAELSQAITDYNITELTFEYGWPNFESSLIVSMEV